MSKQYYLYFLLSLSVLCCSSVESDDKLSSINITQSKITLSHGDLLLSNFPTYISKIIGSDSLLIFDSQTETFLIYDMVSKLPIWNHKFAIEGPDFIDRPVLDANLKGDTLIILSNHYFSYYDLNGRALSRISPTEIPEMNTKFSLLRFTISEDNKIFFPKSHFGLSGRTRPLDSSEKPFIEMGINEGSIKELDIGYPEEMISIAENQFFEEYGRHFCTAVGNEIIFNFRFSSEIHRYNRSNKTVSSYLAKSTFTKNTRPPFNKTQSKQELLKARFTGPNFSGVHFDKSSGYFVRLHTNYTLLPYAQKGEGDIKAERYLMIMDSDFNVLKEFEIKERTSDQIFVKDRKIYVWGRDDDPDKENTYLLHVYTINSN